MNATTEPSIKIVLIEQEAGDVAWIEGLVREGDAPAEVTDAIAAERPDIGAAEIILLGLQDLGLVEKEALARLHASFPCTPLIVLAGPAIAARAAEAVGLGAQHVLAKSDLTPAKLASALRLHMRFPAGPLTHTA